jgi:hypothetical protein
MPRNILIEVNVRDEKSGKPGSSRRELATM